MWPWVTPGRWTVSPARELTLVIPHCLDQHVVDVTSSMWLPQAILEVATLYRACYGMKIESPAVRMPRSSRCHWANCGHSPQTNMWLVLHLSRLKPKPHRSSRVSCPNVRAGESRHGNLVQQFLIFHARVIVGTLCQRVCGTLQLGHVHDDSHREWR